MTIETRVRSTGFQGGGGGSSDSAGLAGTDATYVLSSFATQFPNAVYIKPGSSVTTHITGSNLFINSISSVPFTSSGLAGKDAVYVLSSFNSQYTNAVYLRPGSSVTTHITGSNLFINATTSGGGGGGTGFFPLLPQQAKLYSNTSAARIDAGTPVWRLLYSQLTQQYGIWQFGIPPDYSSNPYVRIWWGVDSGMAVVKSGSWIAEQWGWNPFLANSSFYIDTYGGTNTVSIALSAGHSSGNLQMLTIQLATVVSMALYNLIRLRISGSGNWVGNAELLGANFEYTRA